MFVATKSRGFQRTVPSPDMSQPPERYVFFVYLCTERTDSRLLLSRIYFASCVTSPGIVCWFVCVDNIVSTANFLQSISNDGSHCRADGDDVLRGGSHRRTSGDDVRRENEFKHCGSSSLFVRVWKICREFVKRRRISLCKWIPPFSFNYWSCLLQTLNIPDAYQDSRFDPVGSCRSYCFYWLHDNYQQLLSL